MLVGVDDRSAIEPEGSHSLAVPYYLIVSLFAQMDVSRKSRGYRCLYVASVEHGVSVCSISAMAACEIFVAYASNPFEAGTFQ